MTDPAPVCEECGASANIHRSNIIAGVPTMHHFCPDCADLPHTDESDGPRRWGMAAVLGSVGMVVLSLSVFADWLRFGGATGFGWRQEGGAVIGALLLLLGAVARVPALLIIGLITCLLSILADWCAFGSNEGFGWQQMLGTMLGACLMIAALVASRSKA